MLPSALSSTVLFSKGLLTAEWNGPYGRPEMAICGIRTTDAYMSSTHYIFAPPTKTIGFPSYLSYLPPPSRFLPTPLSLLTAKAFRHLLVRPFTHALASPARLRHRAIQPFAYPSSLEFATPASCILQLRFALNVVLEVRDVYSAAAFVMFDRR